jgi:acetyl esterase/lipase
LIIAGSSAGGGTAAGTALLSRDRGGPRLCGQVLICPMLDDRNETISSHQYVEEGSWSRGSNLLGWTCLLGDRRGGDQVSIYAAPARATDLSRLPPAFIDVGSAEVFRDEAVNYASLLWKSEVQAELHVFAGGFHGFDLLVPNAGFSIAAREARRSGFATYFSDCLVACTLEVSNQHATMHRQSNLPQLHSVAEAFLSENKKIFTSEAAKFELNSAQLMQGHCAFFVAVRIVH